MSKDSQPVYLEEDRHDQQVVVGSLVVTLLLWATLATAANLTQIGIETAHLIVAAAYAVAVVWTYRCLRYLLNDRRMALQISALPGCFLIVHLLGALWAQPTDSRLGVVLPELLALVLMLGCGLVLVFTDVLKRDRR